MFFILRDFSEFCWCHWGASMSGLLAQALIPWDLLCLQPPGYCHMGALCGWRDVTRYDITWNTKWKKLWQSYSTYNPGIIGLLCNAGFVLFVVPPCSLFFCVCVCVCLGCVRLRLSGWHSCVVCLYKLWLNRTGDGASNSATKETVNVSVSVKGF